MNRTFTNTIERSVVKMSGGCVGMGAGGKTILMVNICLKELYSELKCCPLSHKIVSGNIAFLTMDIFEKRRKIS